MIRAVIFDLDGVLIDSEKSKAKSWERVLSEYGIKNGGSWYRYKIGMPGKEIARMAIEEFSLNLSSNELFDKNRRIYLNIANKKVEPINSSIRFLKSIDEDIFRIGLASSEYSSFIRNQLSKIDIYKFFDAIASGVEEVKRDKPAPDIYLLIAMKLNVNPKRCIAIEDSAVGVKAAKNACMKCIGYQNPVSGDQNLLEADIICENLSKPNLLKIINRF